MTIWIATVIAFLAAFSVARPVAGQDVLAEHKIRSLRGLSSVAIVIRPSTDQDRANVKEWGDRLEVALTRAVPSLGRSKTDDAKAWLELVVVSTSSGAALELGLYRWARIIDSGEEVFSKVWSDSKFMFGSPSDSSLRESLDQLVTSLAADLARANR